MSLKLDNILDVISDVKEGRMVVIVDDEDRENEGDIMVAAEFVNKENISFMMNYAKGLICLSLEKERLKELALPLQTIDNKSTFHTNFSVSFDSAEVSPFGITAESRTKTILDAVNPKKTKSDFIRPGFVYPLMGVSGGVLKRKGQTEGSIDLAKIALLKPAGVICEIMSPDGKMLSGKSLNDFCKKHSLKITSIEEITKYRLKHQKNIRREISSELDEVKLVSSLGVSVEKKFKVIVYVDDATNEQHLALIYGEPKNGTLVRIHSECLTGDVFGSLRCDCGHQLEDSLKKIVENKEGILIYLYQEGRGIGLGNKLKAYSLQDKGLDTFDANIKLGFHPDQRDYRVASAVLKDLDISSIRLITNNPDKISSLSKFNIEVKERVIIKSRCNDFNRKYLETKIKKFSHQISLSK